MTSGAKRRPSIPGDARLVDSGKQLSPIRSQKPGLSWLQGPGPTDLWTWRDPAGAIQHQELSFHGRAVIARGAYLTTGRSAQGGSAPYGGEAELIETDREIDVDTLRAALVILGAVAEPLRDDAVQALADQIRGALPSPPASGAP